MPPDDFSRLACACGSTDFRRVVIERPGKPPHRTVLAECGRCHAAFVSPQVPPSALPHPPFTGFQNPQALPPGQAVQPLSEAENEAIRRAAARANKGKPRGFRT